MTKLILIRHGRTLWNIAGRYQGQSDVELSPEGIFQAKKLAEKFPTDQLDAIYSSDLQRAKFTALCLSEVFHCRVQTSEALRELNFGRWEGLTYPEIAHGWPKESGDFFQHPENLQIPGGETFAQVQERGWEKIQRIVKAHPEETVAVVAHGAILRTLLAAALHIPLQYVWSMRQDNTAVNILRYEDGHWMIELMNSTEHLR